MEGEVLIFPIPNEEGFQVTDEDSYIHMIHFIIETSAELMEEYPENPVLVVYTV